MNLQCPDCRNQLLNSNRCSCGWRKSLINTSNNFRCQYMKNNLRCEKEGTISKQIKGNIWYCNEHYDN